MLSFTESNQPNLSWMHTRESQETLKSQYTSTLTLYPQPTKGEEGLVVLLTKSRTDGISKEGFQETSNIGTLTTYRDTEQPNRLGI